MNSIWSQTCEIKERRPLSENIRTDVAVIGAGMAGVLIASALQEAGRSVIVLEANRIASGQTRNTTAKITSQHGLIYQKLTKSIGEERARQYAMANEAAINAPMSTAATSTRSRPRRRAPRSWGFLHLSRRTPRSPFPSPARCALRGRRSFTR